MSSANEDRSKEIEQRRIALSKAARASVLQGPALLKYEASATNQEIVHRHRFHHPQCTLFALQVAAVTAVADGIV